MHEPAPSPLRENVLFLQSQSGQMQNRTHPFLTSVHVGSKPQANAKQELQSVQFSFSVPPRVSSSDMTPESEWKNKGCRRTGQTKDKNIQIWNIYRVARWLRQHRAARRDCTSRTERCSILKLVEDRWKSCYFQAPGRKLSAFQASDFIWTQP